MNKPRVLVVDDKPDNLYLLRSLLQGSGFEVDEARHGAEALSQAQQKPPDLVISDILMPVMDGFALCREWKKDRRLTLIPFIFYTATYTDTRDKEFALSLGATRFIVKPEEPAALLLAIRETIEQYESLPGNRTPSPPNDSVRPSPTAQETREESAFFKQYNEVLVRKLESKMDQLELEIAVQKDTERALRRERDFFDAVLNSLPGIFCCYDKDLLLLRWNKNFELATGFSAAEIACMKPLDFVAEADKDAFGAIIRKAFDTGAAEAELDWIAKDGKRILCHFVITSARISGQSSLIVIGIDVSPGREAQRLARG